MILNTRGQQQNTTRVQIRKAVPLGFIVFAHVNIKVPTKTPTKDSKLAR